MRGALLAAYWLALFAGTHWPELELPTPEWGGLWLGTDKWLHLGAYAGLVALGVAYLAPRAGAGVALRRVLPAVLVYSVLDEWTQAWVPGRFASFGDWVASVAGAGLGALVAGVWFRGTGREVGGPDTDRGPDPIPSPPDAPERVRPPNR